MTEKKISNNIKNTNKTHSYSPFRGIGGFLFKGLLRDRSRSLLPIIVVALGVMITVFMHSYMGGVFGESLEKTANFTSGHVCVETRAYTENLSQMPNDLALTDGIGSHRFHPSSQPFEIVYNKNLCIGARLD